MNPDEIEIVARAIAEKDSRKPFDSLPDPGHYERMARHVLTALDQYREGKGKTAKALEELAETDALLLPIPKEEKP